MKVIPNASAIVSIKYAMLCTRSIVYPTLILAREYNSDLGVDHWTAVKIILSFLPLTSFERNSFSRKDPFLAMNVLPTDL